MAIPQPLGGTVTQKVQSTLSGMQQFTESIGFIVFFFVLVILSELFAGNKITYRFLLLVFASMVVLNAGKFKDLMKGVHF